jgi:hypothetical protein
MLLIWGPTADFPRASSGLDLILDRFRKLTPEQLRTINAHQVLTDLCIRIFSLSISFSLSPYIHRRIAR